MGPAPLRALVAEDDADTLHMLSEAVEQFGAEVTCAANGDELIARLADGTYDFVVTDVSMPWMSGLQALHAARTAGLATPIVVITAVRTDEVARQVGALGGGATLLYKPFGLDELYQAIESVLSAHGPTSSTGS